MKKLFIIVLRYVVDLTKIANARTPHLEFLDEYFKKGFFLASGRQNPKYGGIIIAKATSREEITQIMQQDPFYVQACAEIQIFEFEPNKGSEGFKEFLKESDLDLFSVI